MRIFKLFKCEIIFTYEFFQLVKCDFLNSSNTKSSIKENANLLSNLLTKTSSNTQSTQPLKVAAYCPSFNFPSMPFSIPNDIQGL